MEHKEGTYNPYRGSQRSLGKSTSVPNFEEQNRSETDKDRRGKMMKTTIMFIIIIPRVSTFLQFTKYNINYLVGNWF